MALVHRLGSRESIDLDFSMGSDFAGEAGGTRLRIERSLQRVFRREGYEPIDVKMAERPSALSQDLASFWGGYAIEFKLVRSAAYRSSGHDMDNLRRSALNIGQGKKFLIDISRYDYVSRLARQVMALALSAQGEADRSAAVRREGKADG